MKVTLIKCDGCGEEIIKSEEHIHISNMNCVIDGKKRIGNIEQKRFMPEASGIVSGILIHHGNNDDNEDIMPLDFHNTDCFKTFVSNLEAVEEE